MGTSRIFVLVLCLVLTAACSPVLPTPAIHSTTPIIDFPACRAASLNFYSLTSENFRSMVTCLNGQNGSIQPYKDLVDSMDPQDLATVLEGFNQHFFSNPQRRNQSLDVIRQLHVRGDLRPLMKGIAAVAETQVLGTLAPLLLKVLKTNEVDLGALKKYAVDLVNQNLLGSGLISLADHFGGINGRSLGLIFSSKMSDSSNSLNSDKVVDILSSELRRSLDDGSFIKVLSALKNPSLQLSSLVHNLTAKEKLDLANYLDYSSVDSSRIFQVQNFAVISDHGVSCFKKGPQYLSTESLFLSLGRELLKRSPGADVDKFFLQILPLDLSITQGNCSFPPGVLEALKANEDIIRLGYGAGKRALFKALLNTSDTKSELAAFKSDYFLRLGPLFTEFERRGAYPFILNLLSEDVTPADSVTLSQLIKRSEVVGVQTNIVSILKTILSQDLHPLGRAVTLSMGEEGSGLGDIFATMASAVSLSSESNPFQQAFSELLEDKELMNKLQPILISMLKDFRLPGLIDFTGKLADNGQLEKILVFLSDVLHTKGLPGLQGPVLANSYRKPPSLVPNYIQKLRETFSNPVRLDKAFLGCKNINDDILANGQSFYFGLRCLSGENSYPQIAKIAEDLKEQNILSDASQIFKELIEVSPYFVPTLDQFYSLEQSKRLEVLSKLYSMAVENPYRMGAQLERILLDGFSSKEVPGFLKNVGRILKTPTLSYAGKTLLDVFSQPPQKVFHSQTQFRLALKNEGRVRAQIASWYPQLSQSQKEILFQTAKENFETHNQLWMTHEGSYPALTEIQWRQEIYSFITSILRTTDLKEIVLALQEMGREGHLNEMFKEAIDHQKVVLHYFSDGTTVPHIMTDWDQLEELVEDANFVYSPVGNLLPFSFHTGVRFEQAVVDSTHYVSDMKIVEFLGERGADITSLGHDKPNPRFATEWVHFKNMIQNFEVLDRISKNGQLRIFQILYAGLSRATPAEYRNKSDAEKNHMAAVFHLDNIGFFSQTTMAMASLETQGKLEYFTNNILGAIALLNDDDIAALKEVFYKLVTPQKTGEPTLLDLVLNKIELIEGNQEEYENIKDALFNVFPVLNKIGTEPTGFLQALASLLNQPQVFREVLDKFLSDAKLSEGNFLKVSNVLRLDPEGLRSIKQLAGSLFLKDPHDGSTALGVSTSFISDLYLLHPREFSQSYKLWQNYLQDARVQALRPLEFLKTVLEGLKGGEGLGSLMGDILVDPYYQQRAISLGYGLAKIGDFTQFFDFVDDLLRSGDFDSLLHFTFDNFSSSIKSI